MFNLKDLHVSRSGRSILAIDALQISGNEFTVILGHNGSGKSTLASLLAGQQAPDSGQIELNGRALHRYRRRELAKAVAFLPQKLPTAAGLNVRELVRLGRFPWRGALGRWNAQDEQIIDNALRQTETHAFADTLADWLSGGERQRAWVAMLLAQQAPILILDEPTSALDIAHQYQLMSLLTELNQRQGCGIIVILHDLNLALRYASHIVALKHGQVAFAGHADLLLDAERLSDLYQSPIKLIDHPQPHSSDSTRKVAVVCA